MVLRGLGAEPAWVLTGVLPEHSRWESLDSRGLRPDCYPGCPERLPGRHVEAWTWLHPRYHKADARGGGWRGPRALPDCHSRRPPLPPTIRGPLGDCLGEQVRVPGANPKQGVPSRCSRSSALHFRAAPTVRRVFLTATAPEHVSLAGRSHISRNSLSATLLDRVAPGKILGRLGRSAGQQRRHPLFLTADSSRGHEAKPRLLWASVRAQAHDGGPGTTLSPGSGHGFNPNSCW